MPKGPHKQHPAAGFGPTSDVIPGLSIDVLELQQARRQWQLNRFDEALQRFDLAVRKVSPRPRRPHRCQSGVRLLSFGRQRIPFGQQ
jgi:hypothetical protein